ncbi:MAG: ABC transporter substrate-binding protein [Pseudolabrys sp.]
MATCDPCAATGDAGDWLFSSYIARDDAEKSRIISPRPGGDWPRRKQRCDDRIPVGRGESTNGALAAKAATKTIPIVFMQGADPVQIGLVDSLSHPGGNLTGIDLLLARVAGKRLELLLELVPAAKQIAYLRNPTNPIFAESEAKEVTLAASTHGLRLLIADASSSIEIEKAFSDFTRQHVDALLVSSDGFFLTHPNQIVTLAARNEIPAVYGWREAMTAGGLMSYGTNIIEAWRQAGVYTGRILKGERPTDLPVQQVTRVELVINLKAAKALGLNVTNTLIGRADEVIE